VIDAEIVRVLKDGYWERTAVVRTSDGELRVRKESRGESADARPWARHSLVREIEFMRSLTGEVAGLFPRYIEGWGQDEMSGPAGYDMAFLDGWRDVGTLIGEPQGGSFFDEGSIADAIVGVVHEERADAESLSSHVAEAAALACDRLSGEPFRELIDADEVAINGSAVPGIRRSLAALAEVGVLRRLDEGPQVRLHGDLILENIIVPEVDPAGRFLFIDPVSVAGVTVGHPAFDLVKYRSYASGELYAIRSGALAGRANSASEFTIALDDPDPRCLALQRAGLGGAFHARYVERYGEPDAELVRLLDGYFSLVMAINTTGKQPLTRALKAAICLAGISDLSFPIL